MGEANASFITDPDKFAVCSLAGIPTMSGKLLKFKQLADALRSQIPELEKERDHARWATRGLFVAQLIKASCDGFIATADAIVDTPQTNAIAKAYEFTSDVAGTVSAGVAGNLSGADLAKASLNRVVASSKEMLPDGMYKEAAEATMDIGKATTNMVIDAANKDADATMNDLISTGAAVGKLAAAGTRGKVMKRFFGAGEALANTARNFVRFYREFKESDSDQMFEGLKRSINQQIRICEKHIDEIHRAIYEWEKERASRLPPSAVTHAMQKAMIKPLARH